MSTSAAITGGLPDSKTGARTIPVIPGVSKTPENPGAPRPGPQNAPSSRGAPPAGPGSAGQVRGQFIRTHGPFRVTQHENPAERPLAGIVVRIAMHTPAGLFRPQGWPRRAAVASIDARFGVSGNVVERRPRFALALIPAGLAAAHLVLSGYALPTKVRGCGFLILIVALQRPGPGVQAAASFGPEERHRRRTGHPGSRPHEHRGPRKRHAIGTPRFAGGMVQPSRHVLIRIVMDVPSGLPCCGPERPLLTPVSGPMA